LQITIYIKLLGTWSGILFRFFWL